MFVTKRTYMYNLLINYLIRSYHKFGSSFAEESKSSRNIKPSSSTAANGGRDVASFPSENIV